MTLPKLILLTSPTRLFSENYLFRELLEAGIPALHVRRGDGSEILQQNLNMIPVALRKATIVHEHPALALKYNLMGVHFKSTSEVKDADKSLVRGKSVHSFEEAEEYAHLDYLYLSPIFNSISKEEYTSKFDDEELKDFLTNWKGKAKLYALGGINAETAKKAFDMGFYGVVALGCVWNQMMYSTIHKNWRELKAVVETY